MEIESNNRFAFLGEDDDGASPVAAPSKKAAASANKASAAQAPAARTSNRDDTRAKPKPIRSEYRNLQGGNPNAVRPAGGKPSFNKESREDGNQAERRDTREPRPPRPRGDGPRGGAGRGGRRFDRHSGSDRVDGAKKDVAGKGTWGDSMDAQNPEAATTEFPAEAENAEVAAEPAEVKPEDNYKSLEQHLESQKKKEVRQVRAANAGVDEAKWGQTVVFKKDDQDFFISKNEKKKATPKERQQKATIEIEQRYSDSSRRGGRDHRGQGRRDDRHSHNASSEKNVNVQDEAHFPSLK